MSDGSDKPVAPEGSDNAQLVAAIHSLSAEIAKLRDVVAALQEAAPTPQSGHDTPVEVTVTPASPILKKVEMPSDPDEDPAFRPVDQVIAGLFLAAKDGDSDAGFDAFLALVHSDRKDAPRSIPSLKEFTWKSLRKNHAQYLSEPDDFSSFRVVSRTPDELTSDTRLVKVFLHAEGRSPVPIQLRRDPQVDDQWRVTDSSL